MEKELAFHFDQKIVVQIRDLDSPTQEILAHCKLNEPLTLRKISSGHRKKFTYEILRANDEKLGTFVASKPFTIHLDRGGEYAARIIRIKDRPGMVQRILGLGGKPSGFEMEIILREIKQEAYKNYIDRDQQIAKTIVRASSQEKDYTKVAMKNYRKAIDNIVALDSEGLPAKAWRTIPVPVNNLSRMYEQEGLIEDALELINWYLTWDDYLGIDDYELNIIQKRKKRLEAGK